MSVRTTIKVAINLVIAAICIDYLFPRLRNDYSCDSSIPSNSAQAAGLEDAQARKRDVCTGGQHACKFELDAAPDGTFRVSIHLVEETFSEGCIHNFQDPDIFVYSRDGAFVRTDEAPYS